MIRPSGRKAKQNAPEIPSATVSTLNAAVVAGRGARVWPSHSGLGA